MFAPRTLFISVAFALSIVSANADPLVYVATFTGQFGAPNAGQFGTIDPITGAYNQIGPSFADPLGGLVPGSSRFVGVSLSGNLDSVNPTTGAVSVIGATGLGGLALDTAGLNGTVYETDLNQNLYTVNTSTGVATLIGNTGIDPAPTNPADLFDESFFTAGGNLYATWDAFNATTLVLVDDPELYQINTTTGLATLVGPTARQIDAAIDVDGTVYAFTATNTPEVLSLDVATGGTTFVTDYNQAAFFITGAAVATPEPGSLWLVLIGVIALLVYRRRRRSA